jgi:FixJ family two-component response regulator
VVGVVDADLASRSNLRRVLEAARYAVREFEHPDTAAGSTVAEGVEVFLTGLLFQGVRGADFISDLKKRAVARAVVVVTNTTSVEAAAAAMKAGASDVLAKPPDTVRLLEAIGTALRDARDREDPGDRKSWITEQLAKLTKKDRDVLRHMAAGSTSKVIARLLGIHKSTVDHRRTSLHQKLGALSPKELVRMCALLDEQDAHDLTKPLPDAARCAPAPLRTPRPNGRPDLTSQPSPPDRRGRFGQSPAK